MAPRRTDTQAVSHAEARQSLAKAAEFLAAAGSSLEAGRWNAAGQRRQMLGLLKMKNTVAYERRPLTETEARQLVDNARRLVRWSREVVDGIA